MNYTISFKVNESIYLKDPESSELGKDIIRNSIILIHTLGFEQFTFKKLAQHMNTTEASVYRYFENKHRLLLYILNWYWNYMAFLVEFNLQHITDTKQKIKTIINLISKELPNNVGNTGYNINNLYDIVIAESSKVYLTKEVNKINKHHVFKAYKELCATIASIIKSYNSKYKYPHSLTSTIIEMAHHHQFFVKHLPKLTDIKDINRTDYTTLFLEDMVFKVLN